MLQSLLGHRSIDLRKAKGVRSGAAPDLKVFTDLQTSPVAPDEPRAFTDVNFSTPGVTPTLKISVEHALKTVTGHLGRLLQ